MALEKNASGFRKLFNYLKGAEDEAENGDAEPLPSPPLQPIPNGHALSPIPPAIPTTQQSSSSAAHPLTANTLKNHQEWLSSSEQRPEEHRDNNENGLKSSPIQVLTKSAIDRFENYEESSVDDEEADEGSMQGALRIQTALAARLVEEGFEEDDVEDIAVIDIDYDSNDGGNEGEIGVISKDGKAPISNQIFGAVGTMSEGEEGEKGGEINEPWFQEFTLQSKPSQVAATPDLTAKKVLGRSVLSNFFSSGKLQKKDKSEMQQPIVPLVDITPPMSSSSPNGAIDTSSALKNKKRESDHTNFFIPSLESVQRLLSLSDEKKSFSRSSVIRALRECKGDEEEAYALLSGGIRFETQSDTTRVEFTHSRDDEILRRQKGIGSQQWSADTADMTEAMLGVPVVLDDTLVGSSQGDSTQIGNRPDEPEEQETSDEEGSASESEESEAEGEFKGGKGDLLTSRYQIEKEVGRGTFGRVFRCIDKKAPDSGTNKVAIKVVHNAGRYYELSLIEAEILRDVNGIGGRGETHCCILLNFFKLDGHACMVFETLGQSLYDFLKTNDYIPFPLYCVQDFSRQMLEAISFLHSMKLVHTDLKPENVLLVNGSYSVQQVGKKKVRIPRDNAIKLIDFGCATYDDDEHKSDLIATRQYRAPEVIMGLPWSYPSDIWSVGCIVAELYCGDQLFETHSNMEHIALIERGIGKWPKSQILNKSDVTAKYFDSHGLSLWRTALDADGRRHVRAMKTLEEFVGADKDTGLLSFFRALLTIYPGKRISAEKALLKSFVRKKKVKKSSGASASVSSPIKAPIAMGHGLMEGSAAAES